MSQTAQVPAQPDPQAARREAGPATGRGHARRLELLAAARRVFERKGYHESRVADIVKEAGASHGTFYTYFEDKETVFLEVARQVIGEVLTGLHATEVLADPVARIRAALKRFSDAYRPAARMVALIEEVGAAHPEVRVLRLTLRDEFVQRSVRGIRRWQAEGIADAALDPELIAEALGSMVDQICHVWWNDGKAFDEDALLDTLTLIWARSIGVTAGHGFAGTHRHS